MDEGQTEGYAVPLQIIAKATELAVRTQNLRDGMVKLAFALWVSVFWFGVIMVPLMEHIIPPLSYFFAKNIWYMFSVETPILLAIIYLSDQLRNVEHLDKHLDLEEYQVLRGGSTGEWWLIQKRDGQAFYLMTEPPEMPFWKRARVALSGPR